MEVEIAAGVRQAPRSSTWSARSRASILDGTIYHQHKKAQVLKELAERDGLSLAHSYAFGDSLNDLPMLEEVGHPVAVNPGRKLRQVAASRGWQIARWS